jgi:Ca2+-binding RTX toxin-like protein
VSGFTLGANVERGFIRLASGLTLTGNGINNVLTGFDGNDTLNGGAGNDSLRGGAGVDTFVYADGFGADTVQDYVPGTDKIGLAGVSGLNTYADVQARMIQVGADVVIDFDGTIDGLGSTLKILGTTIATLNANQGDFLL